MPGAQPLTIDETLFRVEATSGLRRAAARILAAGVRAVDPYAATGRAIEPAGRGLRIGGRIYPLPRGARLIVVGAGKGGAPMARAAEHLLGDRITAGVISVPRAASGQAPPRLRRIALREAGHPVPDAAGEAAAREILSLVTGLGPADLVLCLLSGGGSALLPLPLPGLTLRDLEQTTMLLLRSGAAITEVNAVRKHLSGIAGGRLARAARPARIVTLAVSDIIGSPLDAIASGPTVPDPTTFAEALGVLARYDLAGRVPPAALELLRRGAAGDPPETPKPGDPAFERAAALVIADNLTAARAAAAEARRQGFRALLLTTYLDGEARHAGRTLAAIARQILATGEPVRPPACVVAAGETTVTVTGSGKGGRNQEVALAAALALEGTDGALVASLATDGIDGPTDAAGGVADGATLARARTQGLVPARHLAENNAYPVLDAAGDLIRTGPTHTNVADLALVLCGSSPRGPVSPRRPVTPRSARAAKRRRGSG